MESLGEYLRREREQRQRSLRDLAEETRIPLRSLQALEEDRPDRLPGMAFARGFLAAYARALGLDEGDVQQRFQAQFSDTRVPGPSELPPEALHPTFPLEPPRRLWRWRIFLIGFVLLAGGVLLVLLSLPTQEPQQSPEPTQTDQTNQINQTNQTNKTKQTSTPRKVISPSGAAVLRLKATEATWVEVRIDDQSVREAYLKPGESLTWKAQERIRLTLGNAGGVRITWNGEDIGIPGRRGEVVRGLLFKRGEGLPRKAGQKAGGKEQSEAPPYPGGSDEGEAERGR